MIIERRVDEYGRTIIDPNKAFDLILKGVDIDALLVEGSPVLDEYNKWCTHFDKTRAILHTPDVPTNTPEEEHEARSSTWMISDDMQTIDVREFLLSMTKTAVEYERVNMEMDLFEERGLVPLLQLMMFLVDHFRRNNIVWGVGRGSSVASYCLFLIGVHKIDPILFDLDVHEFLK